MSIKCCKNCVAPKRHPGCHSTCQEYQDAIEENKKEKEWLKQNTYPEITNYDFNEIRYVDNKRHKRKKHKKDNYYI